MISTRQESLCLVRFMHLLCTDPFINCYFITARKRSLRRLCFDRCLSFYREGVCIQGGLHLGAEGLHLGGGGRHPGGDCIQGSGVCIQGEGVCIQRREGLHPGGRVCTQGGLHPGGREVCIRGGWADPPPPTIGYYEIRSTSERYASYWNAFLLIHIVCVLFVFIWIHFVYKLN